MKLESSVSWVSMDDSARGTVTEVSNEELSVAAELSDVGATDESVTTEEVTALSVFVTSSESLLSDVGTTDESIAELETSLESAEEVSTAMSDEVGVNVEIEELSSEISIEVGVTVGIDEVSSAELVCASEETKF